MHPEVVSDQPGRCPECGMKLLVARAGHHDSRGDMRPITAADGEHGGTGPAAGHADHGHQQEGHGTAEGIEWEDDMVEVNRLTTTANMRWKFVDRTAAPTAPYRLEFTVGDRVKIRLVNEMDSDHPMHHPFHLHGAGRFLVLARDGVAEPNLVWKDTVLVRTGQTVDILFDVTNPGLWMAHCHIAEHMQSGMMFSFTVPAPGRGGMTAHERRTRIRPAISGWTWSSSAAARPVWPWPGIWASRACGSWSWRPPPSSATSGGPGGTR